MKACFESSEGPPPSPESGGVNVLVCLAVRLGECVGSGSGQGRILKGFRTLFCWTSVCQQDGFIRDVATGERGFCPRGSSQMLECYFYSVVLQIFIEHLLCAMPCFRCGSFATVNTGKPCLHGAYVLVKKDS